MLPDECPPIARQQWQRGQNPAYNFSATVLRPGVCEYRRGFFLFARSVS